jgi:pimeloyl-ACP methyl ester carboxylesterase
LKKLKYILLILGLWFLVGSCFQFRKSDKKQLKELHEVSKQYHVELGFKDVGDRLLHYTQVGTDTSKPLAIFIHGSPGSSSNFIHFGKDTTLLKKYNVLLIDRPGFGYSDFGNSEPSLEKQATQLSIAIKQFNFRNKVLVGHSLGGPLICRMAMDDSSIANGLLIVAGSVSPELEPTENWRKFMDRKVMQWLMPKSFVVSNQEIMPAKGELIKMTPMWGKITNDVKIIQGLKDNLVPSGNEDYAEKMLVNAKSVEVFRYEDEDHFIPFSKPELVTSALLRFSF